MKKSVMVFAVASLLSACAIPVEGRVQPHFAYKAYPPIILNVASINVEQNYISPAQSPNAEHLMPLPLPQAVADWAKTHFVAGGGDGTATITIKDASMKTQNLPRTGGLEGVVTVDQAERYDAKVSVDFRVENATLGHNGSGSVNVARGQSVGEDASIADRDRAWTSMEELIMTDLDAGTQKMLRDKMPGVVKE